MSWKCVLEFKTSETKILVTNNGDDVLKARICGNSNHPRALLTMLEGLALWQGKPIRCVISAAEPVNRFLGLGAFGDELWPHESALVRFEVAAPSRRRRRIEGFGVFRQLRLVEGDDE